MSLPRGARLALALALGTGAAAVRDAGKAAALDLQASMASVSASSHSLEGARAEEAQEEEEEEDGRQGQMLDEQARLGLHRALAALLTEESEGCDLDVTESVPAGPSPNVTRLFDQRGCYPHLEEACPNLQGLLEHLARTPPKLRRNIQGNSGAQVLLAPGREHEYVVKSVKDSEVVPIRTVLMKLYAEGSAKQGSAPSVITPVCFTATLQYRPRGWIRKSAPAPETWIVMRRMRLGVRAAELHTKMEVKPKMFDVKGPVWGFWDAKSRVRGNWRGKDRGFQRAFPDGLQLVQAPGACAAGCGGLERSLTRDSGMLESLGVTDYSLLIQIYEGTANHSMCASPKRFPAYVEAQDPHSGKHYVLAVGIIDYGATEVAASWKIGSTMIAPARYLQAFRAIWGAGDAKPGDAYLSCSAREA